MQEKDHGSGRHTATEHAPEVLLEDEAAAIPISFPIIRVPALRAGPLMLLYFEVRKKNIPRSKKGFGVAR